MKNKQRRILVTETFKEDKFANMLVVGNYFDKSLFTKVPFQLALLFLIINFNA
jgi:hypothetical protein